jgi:hypothetical protein
MGQDILFDSLDNKPTFMWISNVFDTATVGSITASNKENLYNIEARQNLCLSTYNTLKSKMPVPSFIHGSIPSTDGWNGHDWKLN